MSEIPTRTFSGGDLPFTVEALSGEFFSLWREHKTVQDLFGRSITLGGPLSFCLVDGNRTYEGAKLDFENCDTFLQIGGFILFDGSTVKTFGFHTPIPEVLANGRYKLVAKNPNHLFQKVG